MCNQCSEQQQQTSQNLAYILIQKTDPKIDLNYNWHLIKTWRTAETNTKTDPKIEQRTTETNTKTDPKIAKTWLIY
jgi:hypothetical protein